MNSVERQIANDHREANARLAANRIHQPSSDVDLKKHWKASGENFQDSYWRLIHNATVTRWRKEGDHEVSIARGNFSTPAGFDRFVADVSKMRRSKDSR